MRTPKIAIIEDDEIFSTVLHDELKGAGFDVVHAPDGESGLRAVRSHRPDLVLLDLVLPKLNGFEVLKALRESPDTSGIPVIVLSVLGSDEDIKTCLRLGGEDYFVKSQHSLAEIVERVKEFVHKPRRLHARPISPG